MSVAAAGRLDIDIRYGDGRILAVHCSLQRPLDRLAAHLTGMPPQQALNLVGMLFSLCGQAHAVAGARALDQLRGMDQTATTEQWREQRVRVERIRETGLHLLRDWQYPGGDPVQLKLLLQRTRHLLELLEPREAQKQGALEAAWKALDDWWRQLKLSPEEGAEWIARRSAPWRGVQLGPALPDLIPAQALDRPVLNCARLEPDSVRQTGPLTAASGLRDGAEVMAATLQNLLEQLEADLKTPRRGMADASGQRQGGPAEYGCGWVQTARGWLLHQVLLEGDRVKQWRITAPTDWNFHAAGALRRRLEGVVVAPERLDDLVRDLVLLHDPCIDYETRIHHA